MKIAIITSGFLPIIDGVTTSLYQRIKSLSKFEHEVLVLCPDYKELQQIYPNWKDYIGEILPNVNIVPLSSKKFIFLENERSYQICAKKELEKELLNFNPDIIHVDEPERIAIDLFCAPGIKVAKILNIPCIASYRTNFIDYAEDFILLPRAFIRVIKFLLTLLIRKTYNKYDCCLVSTSVTAEKVKSLGITNVNCQKFLGIDLEQFSPNKIDKNAFELLFSIKEVNDKIKILFIGRLTPDKGWNFTFKALAEFAKENIVNNLHFIIAGLGPMQTEILKFFEDHNFNYSFLGKVAHQNVSTLMANCNLHVTTSLKETLGLTVIESFASGTPVLVARSGGVTEFLLENVNGLAYEPNNINDFKQMLRKLVYDHALRKFLASNCQKSVVDLDWEKATIRWLKLANELIHSKSRL